MLHNSICVLQGCPVLLFVTSLYNPRQTDAHIWKYFSIGEESHNKRMFCERVKKTHWNTSEMHWSAPTGGGRVYKFLPRYLCSRCTRKCKKSSLAASHCFSGHGGVICTTTNGQKLLFSSTRHVGHVTEPGLALAVLSFCTTIGRQEHRPADTNLQPRSCNFKKCFHWLCGCKMSS